MEKNVCRLLVLPKSVCILKLSFSVYSAKKQQKTARDIGKT